jgi:hypothetical protein
MSFGKAIVIGCCGVIAGCVVLMIGAGIVLTLGIQTGHLPDSVARGKNRIPDKQLEDLRKAGIIEDGEDVQFFYSAGVLSIMEDGNLFTDRRVISYERIDDQLAIQQARYHEIESIDFEKGSLLEDAVITVNTKRDSRFVLYVSAESRQDRAFHKALMAMWAAKKGETPAEPAAEDESLVDGDQ